MMRINRILLPVLVLVCVLALASDSLAQLLGNRSAPVESAAPAWMPDVLRDVVSWIVLQQSEFSRALREAVTAYRDGHSMLALYALVGLSFLYGVFHAVGPGHGKAVVASYFMARESQLRRGIMLGAFIAAIQSVTAIVIVAVMGWILDFSRIALLDSMPLVEAGSYILIVILGLRMTWAALTGRDCDHDHSGLDHAHHNHENEHGHDHVHSHSHAHNHEHPQTTRSSSVEFLGAAVVSGLRPCTGALIVLLFALANDIFTVGILSALAMGVGVALTVSSVGMLVILTRRGIVRAAGAGAGVEQAAGSNSSTVVTRLTRGLSIAGSVMVCLIGILLLISLNMRQLPG